VLAGGRSLIRLVHGVDIARVKKGKEEKSEIHIVNNHTSEGARENTVLNENECKWVIK